MGQRPTSVTVICWVIIGIGAIALLSLVQYLILPLEEIREALQHEGRTVAGAVMSTATLGIILVGMGLTMLKGMNWSRLLFLVFAPVSTLVSLVLWGFQFNLSNIISIMFYLICLYYLTRPAAVEFYRGCQASSS